MLRLSCGVALGAGDAVALPTVAVGWSLQEWAIHKYLLHGFEVMKSPESKRLRALLHLAFVYLLSRVFVDRNGHRGLPVAIIALKLLGVVLM